MGSIIVKPNLDILYKVYLSNFKSGHEYGSGWGSFDIEVLDFNTEELLLETKGDFTFNICKEQPFIGSVIDVDFELNDEGKFTKEDLAYLSELIKHKIYMEL